jgi:hypothetical protein
MGNGQSTSQRIEQIVENYTEANAISSARSQCTQRITVDARDALIINCGGWKVDQQCSAMSNANLDTVVKALQSATLDSESTQVAEGVALAMNVSVTDNEMVSKTLNQLVANCQSNANNVIDKVDHFDMRGMVMDCTQNPDANVLRVTQYGDAEASCVVKQIVDAQQQNSASSTTSQKNIGFTLPQFSVCIGVIALVILAPAFMPGGKKSNELEKLLQS